jgi:hypothetical protein
MAPRRGSAQPGKFVHMFDLPAIDLDDLATADDAAVVDAIRGWTRVEDAACARKLAAIAELFCRRTGQDAGEREHWWLDPVSAIAAELGAAQGTTQGLALAQTHCGVALRDRLPKIAALFAAGEISHLLVRAIVWRTGLIMDPEAMDHVDTALAAQVTQWGPMSVKKTEQAIDALVDEHDPGALRRTRIASRGRAVVIGSPNDEVGIADLWGRLYATDAATLDRRLNQLARSVCADDPRTLAQRRADALGALAAGQDLLACGCGSANCPAGEPGSAPSNVVIHVVAHAAAVASRPSAELSGESPYTPVRVNRDTPLPDLLVPKPADSEPRIAPPGIILGGGVLPTPLLAALMDRATIRPIHHPGDSPPEPGYRPTAALEAFVRCRDLTCRFPGCDRPADVCDIDHTVPYPVGPTHASNLKCMCRAHHLLKTFWSGVNGWRERQLPDGTVIWTAPTGHTYTTRPGSALLFPTLCEPTGTLPPSEPQPPSSGDRGVMMPRRRRTRAQDRANRINAERRLNDPHVAERNEPPPF